MARTVQSMRSAFVLSAWVLIAGVASGQVFGPGGPGGPGMPGRPIGPGGIPPGLPGGAFGPGAGPGIPGPGIPGMDRYEFICRNCNAKVGEGMVSAQKEMIAKCPNCGVTFGNTAAGRAQARMEEGPGGWRNRPGARPSDPGGIPAAPAAPAPFEPANANPAPFNPPFQPVAPGISTPTSAPPARVSRSFMWVWIVLVVAVLAGLAVFVAIIGGVIWMISTAPAKREPVVRTKSKRADYEPI